jgi:hypothetical protein
MHKSIRDLQDQKVELQKSLKNMIEEIGKNNGITATEALRFKQKLNEDKIKFQSKVPTKVPTKASHP